MSSELQAGFFKHLLTCKTWEEVTANSKKVNDYQTLKNLIF